MSNYRARGHSPSRYQADQPRSTTGNVYVTSFDSPSKSGSSSTSSHPRASISTASSGRSSVAYQAQPMRKSTYADGKTTRTEYAIRPRNENLEPIETKRPLSISTRGNSPPRRGSALVTSPREMTPTAGRDNSSHLLQPASAHGHGHSLHQRHNSTSMADLSPREMPNDRRERSYRSRAPYVQKAYYADRQPARGSDDEGWSYTGPREQFDRDYPQKPPDNRGSASRKERPMHYHEMDHPRRDQAPPQSHGRTPTGRDRVERDYQGQRSGFESDPDRTSEAPRRRHATRQPVLHQQLQRDDGYSSARDDYESRGTSRHKSSRYEDEGKPREHPRTSTRENDRDRDYDRDYDRKYHRDSGRERPREYDRDYAREYNRDNDRDRDRDYKRDERAQEGRRKPRSRDSSPERSGLKTLATSALGSLAAAGVIKGVNRDHKDKESTQADEEPKERRHRKHRHRSRKDDSYEGSDVDNERRKDDRARSHQRDSSNSESSGEQRTRRRSHRRRKEDEDNTNGQLVPQDDQAGRSTSKVRTREGDEAVPDEERQSRALVPVNKDDQDFDYLESRTISPGENGDDRPRRVQLVEPVRDKEDLKPRGILKPARQVPFPEDPNPIREGVAPLKDATKDGIPPNARWTKINRLLVNPEALEKAQERFEERDEYVIVLRVLSREEIKKLADKTKEIREAREREWQQKLEERRRRGLGNDSETTYSDGEIDYDDDGRQRPQLAIEQAPPAPPADLRNLSNAPNQQASNQQVPQRVMPNGPPIPDINVEANYSQNV